MTFSSDYDLTAAPVTDRVSSHTHNMEILPATTYKISTIFGDSFKKFQCSQCSYCTLKNYLYLNYVHSNICDDVTFKVVFIYFDPSSPNLYHSEAILVKLHGNSSYIIYIYLTLSGFSILTLKLLFLIHDY